MQSKSRSRTSALQVQTRSQQHETLTNSRRTNPAGKAASARLTRRFFDCKSQAQMSSSEATSKSHLRCITRTNRSSVNDGGNTAPSRLLIVLSDWKPQSDVNCQQHQSTPINTDHKSQTTRMFSAYVSVVQHFGAKCGIPCGELTIARETRRLTDC